MTQIQKNIPILRFPEFNGEWGKRRLGELADVSKLAGYEFTKHITYEKTGKIIALRGLNIKNNGLDLTDVKYIDNSELSKLSRSKLYVDDLMFTYIGTIGEVALIEENDRFYLAPNVSRIRVNKNLIIPKFILQFFNLNKFKNKEIAKYVSSSSQPALSMESVRKFQIKLPTLEEQQKIATFLTSVDKRIQALVHKKELLEQYKKGVMQKIFNREIRFQPSTAPHHLPLAAEPTTQYKSNNSYSDWEVKKLGEIAIKESSNISANTIENNTGNYKIYGATGFLQNVDFYHQEEEYISIVKDGAGVGRTLLCEAKSSVLGTLDIIKPKKEVNLYFLYSVLNNINFTKYVTGSTIPHIYFKDYSKQKIEIPCLEEQQKIAGFLSAIDTKIEAVTSQIDYSKTFKKGLLQKMFV